MIAVGECVELKHNQRIKMKRATVAKIARAESIVIDFFMSDAVLYLTNTPQR